MKKILPVLFIFILLWGCSSEPPAQIAATTLPVYDFTLRLCQGTGLSVTRLVTEEISCLHDYSLNVRQVKAAEAAEIVVISGAGLEEFLHGVIDEEKVVDSSAGVELLCPEEEEEHEEDGHHHEADPHIWLSPVNAAIMAQNICEGLTERYPEHKTAFQNNLSAIQNDLSALQNYGHATLKGLSAKGILTFHDGFSYFAQAFGLEILKAIEEESGREASAKELIEIIQIVEENSISAIFTEENGSLSAAKIISRETGCKEYSLSMAMSGPDYFTAMYHNIDQIREALQ